MRKNLLASLFFIALIFVSWESYGQCPTTQSAITTGNGTWVVPANVTSITVETWGGGGRGGGSSSNGAYGGGGGGGYSRSTIAVTPGQTFNYSVGAGSTNNNNPGGNSWFSLTTEGSSIVRALGGSSVPNSPTGAVGGGLGTGTIRYTGGSGADAGADGGGGGSSAGTGANGINGSGGTGGSAPTGGGNGGDGASGSSGALPGNSGIPPGGGGGGAVRNSGNPSGGNGGNGQIVITTIIPPNTVTSASTTPTLCINTALTSITHTTTGATGIGAATGLPAGVTASWAANTITISGTPTPSGTFNYSIPLTGGCNNPAVNATGTITVTPNNTVSAPSSSPTLCINMALTAITHSTTGATGIGAATGLPAGVTAAWAGNNITISGTPTASGTFNYSIPLTGGCNTPAVNATGTITVTPNNTASAPSSTPTLCINTALTAITHSTTRATGIGAPSGLPAGVTASWAANTITISGTPTASGTFNYSIPLTGGCNTPAVNATGTITVTPNITVTAPSSTPTLCINTALSAITHATTGATGIGVATGLPTGVTAAWAGNTITISGTPTASGTFNYSIPLTGGCNTPAVNATGTITVSPNNTVSAPSSAPTLCINTALTAITHSTTGATGVGAATGLPAGVTASWAGNTITISGTPTASGTFNYSIPLTGGCNTPAVNATGTITVTPNNTVSAPSSAPTLCINTALMAITHSTTGATGVGAATGLPAGVTASWAGNTITISGTPTASGTFNYSIPLTGGCGTADATGTITVNPATTITSESLAAQTICDGQNFTSISITATGTGTLNYQWYTNTTNNNTTGTSIGGATSSSYTPPSSAIGTNYYYVVVSSNCGSSVTSTISGAFTVNPMTVITAQPDNTNYDTCFGDGFSPISVTATGTALTYQWFSNTANSNSGGTLITGATSTTFTPPSTPEGITYYYVEVTGTCGILVSDVSGIYEVFPPITQIVLDPSPNPQTICLGDSFTQIDVTATGAGMVSYQWYSNSSASNSGGALISGATSQAYTPLSGTVGTTYYYAVANSDCGTVPTAVSGAFTVNPLTSIDSEILTGATICEGNGPFSTISVSASGPGTLNYQWYSNTINSNSGGSPIAGTNSNSFTPPSNVVGPAPIYYYVEVSSTGGCGPSKTSTVSGAFIVNPNPTANAGAAVAAICQGATSVAMGGSVGGGATGGTWSGGAGTWTNANNPSTATYTAGAAESGTITLTLTTSGGSCGSTTTTKTITINPNPTANAGAAVAAICQGATSVAMGGSVGGGATGGTWSGGAGTWTNATNPSTATYTAGAAESGTITLTLTTSGGSCGTTTATKTITVNPATTITSESLAAQTICDGQNFTSISISATGTGTVTYQWYTNTTNNNTTGTSIGGATSSSYTPTSAPIGTNYYYVIASSDCGSSVTSTISGAFTVDPITSIISQPDTSDQLECFGDGFNPISVSANGANLTYQWYKNSTSSNSGGTSIPGANSASFTPPSNSQGAAFYYVVVTGNCRLQTSDVSGEFTVTPPATTITQDPSTTSQIICLGDSFNSISVFATGEGTVSYQWHSNSSASNSGGAVIPGATSSSYTPLSATVGTTYYYAVANSDCGTVPTAVSGAFTVNPLTSIDSESLTGATICEGNGPFFPISVSASGTGTLNYQWFSNTSNSNSGGSAISGANSNSFTPPSNVVGPAPVYYYVEVSSTGGCGPSVTSTVSDAFIVNPNNTVSAASTSPTVCINTAIPTVTLSTANATGISDSGVSGANGLPAGVSASWASNTITISGTPTVSGTFNYSIPLTGGCGTVNATGTITVNPDATVGPTSVASPSVCISSPNLAPFTQPTTGVTSIGAPTGLPLGITASFNSSNGLITFSGTANTTGLYSYSIPLTGPCTNGLTATGTIDVTPEYDITAVSSVSATTISGAATVTFYADPTEMLDGTYNVTYQIKQASGAFTTVGPVNATVVNGKGTFTTTPIVSNEDTYTVQILTIKKSTDVCTVTLPSPPTTYFGVCSAVFTGNSTFFVPANVYSITIEVYGGGGGGGKGSSSGGGGGGAYSIRQIAVVPGEPLGVIAGAGGNENTNGGDSYVTRDTNLANKFANSLLYSEGGRGGSPSTTGNGGVFDPRYSGSNGNNGTGKNGGNGAGPLGGAGGNIGTAGQNPGGGGGASNGGGGKGGSGLVVISYSCPDADVTDCIKVIDDGAKSGTTIIEYTCDDTWIAPEGLVDFTVIVGSGGGGGGSGEGAGGGGSGALIMQSFSTNNPYGIPSGTSFDILVGEGGLGATIGTNPGVPGDPTSFTGSLDGNPINIIVSGGGGGGSQSSNNGSNGASGGGGGATPSPGKSSGVGGNSIPITYTGTNVTVYQGNIGGLGDYSEPQNSIAGGGGGGLTPWGSGNDGQNGKAAGAGQGEGGRGGDGIALIIGDSTRYYGGGGGGIGEYFNGTEKIGEGGTANGITIGGDGNLDINNTDGIGYPGVDKTGSGGGAGYYGGGKGGNGVVYIYYFNYRVLEVEFLYFEAKLNSANRSGQLTWATSQEWENNRFEIERAINGDLTSWKKIGEVKGQGYKDSPTDYSYEDRDLPASGGDIFYRLKQLDIDGSYAYSVTRSIQVPSLKGQSRWIVYPNPSSPGDFVTVDLLDRSNFRDEQILIKVSDVKGVYQTYSVRSVEEVGIAVNNYLEQAAPGIHIVQLIWGTNSEQLKILRR
ncbi:hypothetical protein U3A58_07920 [Algoriphagus sp. C2-6-M1]|uniref:glycine-rich domain-containing protein n=1 Tax=Algoriphagus persicinus TaxID=3108754 RepID=UPI002B384829|nr:hypothetical protein [Algoriphagus sp. C2-6-M1]MEB2780317.1 hypothetical protein [Algoriphagus sp. C2-6-M1]